MTRPVTLVVNPAARKGATLRMIDPVTDILRAHGWRVDVVVTRSADHASQVAADANVDDLLVTLGGDGLYGRVAAGAVVSGCLMAPLPAGRGHDLVRALGGPGDVRRAAQLLAVARERRLDVGLAGDGDPSTATVFLGVATLGYDSMANTYANDAPRAVPSSLVYAYGGARTLVHARPRPLTLVVDGVTHEFTGWNVAIGNSGRFGAGMRVNPDASMSDGLLDVTVVTDIPRWHYPAMLPRLFRGTHVDGVRVRALRGRDIRVITPHVGDVYADGDLLEASPTTFRALPDALRVLVPAP